MANVSLPPAQQPVTMSGTISAPASSGSTSSAAAGGGRGRDPYAAYVKAQEAKERKAKRKAADRYIEQAQTLALQAKALRKALGDTGFRAAMKQKLANIKLVERQSDQILLDEYNTRVSGLARAAEDNERAASAQTYANLTNASRERANAMSEAMLQGAGETDLLRAQQMSLRNWNANQSEVNRAFHDTLTSINASLDDLTADTRTARFNNAVQANADRAQVRDAFFGQQSEAYTQLGNVLGEMSEMYNAAYEQVEDKKTKRRRRRTRDASGAAFMNAAAQTGKAYKNPGVSPAITQWAGAPEFEGALNNSAFTATNDTLARPEGASLRKWST